ncbi:MAG TPA: class I SAM-dependent methyltransferase [Streptosporangiaceae bacterium]|nr:class I SAM-dependent methyltransferase [Streptosporangiaceae bacterium]
MTNSLMTAQADAVLRRLHAAADDQESGRVIVPVPPPPPGLESWHEAPAAQRADALQDIYIPISAEAGRLLYALVRAIRPQTVVEFGTSFGISTIYLATAVADNRTGHVYTTELSSKKVAAAQANLEEAGVAEPVTVLEGDALHTLADVAGPVGLVLLDGWKDLCLPVLRLLEPKLAPGALVAADDITHAGMAAYLDFIRSPASGYVSVAFPVEDGMEISSWTGR